LLQWNVQLYLHPLDSQVNKRDLKEDSADVARYEGVLISEWEAWPTVKCGKHRWASKWASVGTTASRNNRARRKHIANGLFRCAHYSAPLLKPGNIWISFLTRIISSYCGVGSLFMFQWRIGEYLRMWYKFEIEAYKILFCLLIRTQTVASVFLILCALWETC
jgi:hypothetical protein